MQSTKTASITETIAVSADEVRALLGLAAKNFAGIVDGKDGVKLVSTDVTLEADGSATVAIVYEQSQRAAVKAESDAAAEPVVVSEAAAADAAETPNVAEPVAIAPSIVIPTPAV